MKIQDLLEGTNVPMTAELKAMNTKLTKELTAMLKSAGVTDIKKMSKQDNFNAFALGFLGTNLMSLGVTARIDNIAGANDVTPTVYVSVVVDIPTVNVDEGAKSIGKNVLTGIARLFKEKYNTALGSKIMSSPWHFKDHDRYTANGIKIGELPTINKE